MLFNNEFAFEGSALIMLTMLIAGTIGCISGFADFGLKLLAIGVISMFAMFRTMDES